MGTPDAFIARITSACAGRGAPAAPVPRIPSTRTPAPPKASSSDPRRTGISHRWSHSARGSAPATGTRATSRPQARSVRSATTASPPLLPAPAAATTLPSGNSRATISAAARPADSITTRSETSAPEKQRISQSRISCAVGSGSRVEVGDRMVRK
jgi:hypothetical protein